MSAMYLLIVFFNLSNLFITFIDVNNNFSISWMGPGRCLVKIVDFIGAEPNTASRILSLSLRIVDSYRTCSYLAVSSGLPSSMCLFTWVIGVLSSTSCPIINLLFFFLWSQVGDQVYNPKGMQPQSLLSGSLTTYQK
jgi:hypothetical protein